MKRLRGAVVALCSVVLFVVFGTILAPNAKADQWDKKTIATFNEPVEIPGMVLQPGTYIFKMANTATDDHIVQIWNADENQLLATLMTVPETRPEPSDKPVFEFEERPGKSPMGVKAWFYTGSDTGEEFIY